MPESSCNTDRQSLVTLVFFVAAFAASEQVWDLITIPLELFDLPSLYGFLLTFGKDGMAPGSNRALEAAGG